MTRSPPLNATTSKPGSEICFCSASNSGSATDFALGFASRAWPMWTAYAWFCDARWASSEWISEVTAKMANSPENTYAAAKRQRSKQDDRRKTHQQVGNNEPVADLPQQVAEDPSAADPGVDHQQEEQGPALESASDTSDSPRKKGHGLQNDERNEQPESRRGATCPAVACRLNTR